MNSFFRIGPPLLPTNLRLWPNSPIYRSPLLLLHSFTPPLLHSFTPPLLHPLLIPLHHSSTSLLFHSSTPLCPLRSHIVYFRSILLSPTYTFPPLWSTLPFQSAASRHFEPPSSFTPNSPPQLSATAIFHPATNQLFRSTPSHRSFMIQQSMLNAQCSCLPLQSYISSAPLFRAGIPPHPQLLFNQVEFFLGDLDRILHH